MKVPNIDCARIALVVLAVTGCDYMHLGVQMLPQEELPRKLDFGPIDEAAGHAVKLPDEPLIDDYRLLDTGPAHPSRPVGTTAFTDYFDGVFPIDPLWAPAWMVNETLDSQATAAARIVTRWGVPGSEAIDPLVDIQGPARPATFGAHEGPCGGAVQKCAELRLTPPLATPVDGDAHWARVRVRGGARAGERFYVEVRSYLRDGDHPDSPITGMIVTLTDGHAPGAAPVDQLVDVELGVRARVARPAFAFVQVSDVQLREGAVKLESERFSHMFDHVVQSLERNRDQERYEPYLYGALVATINAEVDKAHRMERFGFGSRIAPELVIHTGDTVDTGLEAEFHRFHDLTDRLTIPWLSVVGNHDILAFGNFRPGRCISVQHLFETIGVRGAPAPIDNFCIDKDIECPSGGDCRDQHFIGDSDDPVGHFISLHEHPATATATLPQLAYAPSRDHGYDLGARTGYYRLVRPLDLGDGVDRRLVMIVLQTADAREGTAAGAVDAAQIAWLQDKLARYDDGTPLRPQDLAIVFAHGPVGSVPLKLGGKELLAVVEASPNLVAFVAGHTHRHGIRPHPVGKTGRGFWEIETASIISFPHEARMVTLKTLGGGVAFLETLTFAQAFKGKSDYREKLLLAEHGALADACNDGFPCKDHLPLPPPRAVTNVRLFFRLPGAAQAVR